MSCAQVGFRQVELGDRSLLVNKRRIWVRGVNRHEHDPLRGKAVTEASMLQVWCLLTVFLPSTSLDQRSTSCMLVQQAAMCRLLLQASLRCPQFSNIILQDVKLMKQLNFNAVRTSHYPNHPRW